MKWVRKLVAEQNNLTHLRVRMQPHINMAGWLGHTQGAERTVLSALSRALHGCGIMEVYSSDQVCFDEHSYTTHCPGYTHIQTGLKGGTHHTEACRRSMEALISQTSDGHDRITRARAIVGEYMEQSSDSDIDSGEGDEMGEETRSGAE